MAKLRDMMASSGAAGVMPEPEWPRCAACGDNLESKLDDRGRPVREGRRLLMRCPACGHIEIAADPAKERRRFRLVSTLGGVSAALLLLAMIGYRVLQFGGANRLFSVAGLIGGVLAAMFGLSIGLAMDAAARVLSRHNRADVRFTWLAYVVFWGVVAGGTVWLALRIIAQAANSRGTP